MRVLFFCNIEEKVDIQDRKVDIENEKVDIQDEKVYLYGTDKQNRQLMENIHVKETEIQITGQQVKLS